MKKLAEKLKMLEVVLLCYVRRNSKRTYRRQTTPATGYLDSWNRLKFKSSYFFHFQSATFSLFYSLYHTVKILELNLNLKGCCNLKKPPTDQVSLGTGNRDYTCRFSAYFDFREMRKKMLDFLRKMRNRGI